MESHPEPAVPPDDSQLSPDDNLSSCTSQTRSLYSSAGLKVKLNGFIRRCLVKYRSSGTNHQGYAHSLSLGSEFSRDVEDAARRQSLVVRLRRHVFDKGVFSKRFLPHLKFLKYHINPYGNVHFFWMGVVSVAFAYNAFVVPMRASFPVQTELSLPAWLFFDYLSDTVYVLDIVLVQFHLSWRVQGVLEPEVKVLAKRYISRWKFWFDFLSCFPLDFFYVIPALRFLSLLRLPRLLKVKSAMLFRDRVEIKIRYPHHFRMIRLFVLFFYAIHIYACVYHYISLWEGIGTTKWVYDGNGRAYVRCFYWATVTVVTSHNLDRGPPSNAVEYIAEMVAYLIGVFMLALIIGEIRTITEAVNAHKTNAYQKWDRVKEYLRVYHIPPKQRM